MGGTSVLYLCGKVGIIIEQVELKTAVRVVFQAVIASCRDSPSTNVSKEHTDIVYRCRVLSLGSRI